VTDQWPLGVCVLKPLPNRGQTFQYARYIFEILNRAGICHAEVAFEDLEASLPNLRMLLTVGEQEFPPALRDALRRWLEGGGAWISLSGVCSMNDVTGLELVKPAHSSWGGGFSTLGEGYLVRRDESHPILADIDKPLHYFNGLHIRSTNATMLAGALDAHGRPTDRGMLFEREVGNGRCIVFAPDITGTVVLIQQGRGVTRDGIPAADGTAPVTDGVLKSGDGAVLDWIFDRDPVPGLEHLHCFLRPIADQWRELVLKSIFYAAKKQRVPLPLLWLWPRKLKAIAHLSHDTDGNDPARAETLLRVLKEGDVRSTWCVICPGYDSGTIEKIRAAGHELAMHYDAMSHNELWSREDFDRQFRELHKLFGDWPATNKNHYLRWEGDCELLHWCEAIGIEMDQSKGASKTGEAGFNFGTCHPFFPIEFKGRMIDVLELPTPTQDLIVFAPEIIRDSLLQAALKHHGVLHLLYHPAHMGREGVPESVARSIRAAREAGLEWWTAKQINDWERGRRNVRWKNYDGSSVQVSGIEMLKDATILWLDVNAPASDDAFGAWGFRFKALAVS
jgi:peptidoglycan/xylan/chitin deacetylase (PgdA/CDA1 family)